MSTSPVRFFAPTYYTPFYFPSLVAVGGGPPDSGPPPYRDRDAFVAIVAALSASGEFADVSFGTTLDRRAAGADRAPAAVITPDTWVELDDVDPTQFVRRVTFLLTLVARDEDPAARFDALDRLTVVARGAINGRDLGGGCLPSLTLIRRGRLNPGSVFPEQGVILHGEFTFLIPSTTGHDPSN